MEFSLKYEGPAVDAGRMNAREIGPVLFAASSLLETSSTLLYGKDGKVRLDVLSDFQHGSFLIDFSVVAQAAENISLLGREELKLILETVGLVGGGGLIGLLLKLRGRKPEKVQAEDGRSVLIFNDNRIILNAHESRLYFDSEVRESLNGVVAPMRKPGIDSLWFGPGREPNNKITSDEADFFKPSPPPERTVGEDVITAIIEIVSIAFKEGNKWRFQWSGTPFFASILDEKFLKSVVSRDATFGAGDALRVCARVTTVHDSTGFNQQWEILEVLEHIPGGRGDQLPLL